MSHNIHNDELVLLQEASQKQGPDLITAAQVLGLPEPVKRYLDYAQVVGEKIHPHGSSQATPGFFRQQPGQKWFPMVAEQYFTTTPPTFVWRATMRPVSIVWIAATVGSLTATVPC